MAVETGQVALDDRSVVGDRCVFPFRKVQITGPELWFSIRL